MHNAQEPPFSAAFSPLAQCASHTSVRFWAASGPTKRPANAYGVGQLTRRAAAGGLGTGERPRRDLMQRRAGTAPGLPAGRCETAREGSRRWPGDAAQKSAQPVAWDSALTLAGGWRGTPRLEMGMEVSRPIFKLFD